MSTEEFSFLVTNGLKAGDVVYAKTSTGAKVKVTIPADAQEGDTVRFALPSQVQAAKLSKKASKADSRLNVRDVDEGGVTNAAPKMTFSIALPPDAVPNQKLVADLPNGHRVVVTVPPDCRPGEELQFRVPAAPDAPPVEVLMKGFLKKKSPKGLPGMHAWQMRWFELTAEHITYWEISMEGEVEEKGAIEVVDLAGVRNHQSDGERLDLLMKKGRLFQLCAPNADERDAWGKAISEALLAVLTGGDAAAAPSAPLEMAAVSAAAEEVEAEGGGGDDVLRSSRTDAEAAAEEERQSSTDAADDALARTMTLGTVRAKAVAGGGKEHAATATAAAAEGGAADGPEVQATAAPAQQAAYISRVARARQANAARRKGSA